MTCYRTACRTDRTKPEPRGSVLTFSQLPPEHLQFLLCLSQGADRIPAAAQEWWGCRRRGPSREEGGQPRGQGRQGSTNRFGQGVKVKA